MITRMYRNFRGELRTSFLSEIIYQKHIQIFAAFQIFSGEQQPVFEGIGLLLRCQSDEAFEGAGAQVGAGDAAQEAACLFAHFQGIEDVEKIFFQGVKVIVKFKADQHVAVDDGTTVVHFAAASTGGDGADGQGGFVVAGLVLAFGDVNDAVFQTLVAAVEEIKIEAAGLIKGADACGGVGEWFFVWWLVV